MTDPTTLYVGPPGGGLYNMLFGETTLAVSHVMAAMIEELSGAGGISRLRLRDGWVEKDPEHEFLLRIYTRNGAGNRECYCDPKPPEYGQGDCIGCRGEYATKHPLYVRDEDDTFDGTYRSYWFRIPNGVETEHERETLLGLAKDPVNTNERWEQALDALRGGV